MNALCLFCLEFLQLTMLFHLFTICWASWFLTLQCACIFLYRMVRDGYFGFKDYFQSLCDMVEVGNDFYLLGADFGSYLEAQVIRVQRKAIARYLWNGVWDLTSVWIQAAADKAFVDQDKWTQMSILSTAGSGRFSSDRTIQDYAENTWGIEPCRCPFWSAALLAYFWRN